MSRFKTGDVITPNGYLEYKVMYATGHDYKLKHHTAPAPYYFPIAIVDRLWSLAPETPEDGIYDSEIVE
jgi:hypothetical protein